jgi:hypothetical protein
MFRASVWHHPGKPYGVGQTDNERHSIIIAGFRGQVTAGLPDGVAIYSGVCPTREAVKDALAAELNASGLHGLLSFDDLTATNNKPQP